MDTDLSKKYPNIKWDNFKIEDAINTIEAYKEKLSEARSILLDYEKGLLCGWEHDPSEPVVEVDNDLLERLQGYARESCVMFTELVEAYSEKVELHLQSCLDVSSPQKIVQEINKSEWRYKKKDRN